MAKHLQRELNIIKKRILSLGASVEERVHKVGGIIESRDIYDANRLIKEDVEIDDQEVEIEEECLKILALHQPVAVDLRFLIAIIKINNDLERIADETVNVAERVLTMAKHTDNIDFTIDYSQMVKQVAAMLKGSLDSLINRTPMRLSRSSSRTTLLMKSTGTPTGGQGCHKEQPGLRDLPDQHVSHLPPPGADR